MRHTRYCTRLPAPLSCVHSSRTARDAQVAPRASRARCRWLTLGLVVGADASHANAAVADASIAATALADAALAAAATAAAALATAALAAATLANALADTVLTAAAFMAAPSAPCHGPSASSHRARTILSAGCAFSAPARSYRPWAVRWRVIVLCNLQSVSHCEPPVFGHKTAWRVHPESVAARTGRA